MERVKMERYKVVRTIQDTLSGDFLTIEEVVARINDLIRLVEAGEQLAANLQHTLEIELTLDEVTSRPKFAEILNEYWGARRK